MQLLADKNTVSGGTQTREFRYLTAAVVVAIVAVSLAAGFALLELRGSAVARVDSSTQSLASSLNQTVDGLFDSMDIALQASSDEIGRQLATRKPDTQSITHYLEVQAQRLPHVAFLRATDHKGDVIYGPGVSAPYANLADREFFKVLQANASQGLFVGKPVVGKISRRAVLALARRVNHADGSFAGTVYASIYVDQIAQILSTINMEAGGSLALRDRDLGLIARYTFGVENGIAMDSQTISHPFELALQRNPDRGSFTSDGSSIDPVVRQYSYQRSKPYGYLVVVGVDADRALGAWRRQVVAVVALLLLFSGALMALLRQAHRGRARLEGLVVSLEESRNALQINNQRLADAEAVQRRLLEKLHTAVVVHGPDTQIIFSNQRAAELLGLTEDQMRGKTAIDPAWCFVDALGRPMAPHEYPVAHVIATLEPLVEMVLGVKTPEREELTWLMVSAFPEFEDGEQLRQVVVNFYDITHMHEADERWRFAVEGSGDGVWDLNLRTSETVYSRRYQEMLGYAEGEFAGTHEFWLSSIHPEDQARMRTVISNYLANPTESYAAEYRLRCKDGSYKWIYARGMVVSRGVDGKPLRMVGTQTDISPLKAAEAKVWNEANLDALTQLPNRRLFYDRLDMEIKQAKRDADLLALLFIDLDHFKEVNDTLGHHVGDQLLIEAAQRIRSAVREGDTVARLGGDEFTVILAKQHVMSDVAAVAQKIIDVLSKPFKLSDNEAYVSASVGVAIYPSDAVSVNDLVKNADQAMYAAKTAGRKGFQFFTQTMHDSAIARMGLVSDLRRAMAAHQFEVVYQPIVDFGTGSILKAEALVRWRHPQRGLVSPAEFIPIAEDIGVIHELGDWVFLQAAQQVSKWQALYGSGFQISVNKSPVQFSGEQRGHGQWVQQLQAMGLQGRSIVIEITEGVLMDSNAKVATSLIQFRDAGIQVAIDDFGTGYSSLSYLKKFDIDYLKIDQSFVQNLAPDTADFALCEAIIVMAHKLGLKVIAEGVETVQQRDMLKAMGCDLGQGYLFSRPLTPMAFEDLLSKQ